jgi:ankyrin repeat protein
VAVKGRKKGITEFLLQKEQAGQSCINTRNCSRETPLHIASRMCDMETATLLIENGADIFSTTSRTMLHYTVDTDKKDENSKT